MHDVMRLLRWVWDSADWTMDEAHLWLPLVLAGVFFFLTRCRHYKWPGPRQMFLMFGAVLAVYEAREVLVHGALHEPAGTQSFASVFAAIALGWVGLDAVFTVRDELAPPPEEGDEDDDEEQDESEDEEETPAEVACEAFERDDNDVPIAR